VSTTGETQRALKGIPIGPTGLIAAVEKIERRLSEFGISIPPGSRLQQAAALLKKIQAGRLRLTSSDEQLVDRVTEQYIVIRSLGMLTGPLVDVQRAKLEEMLSGADRPEVDRNPHARNIQFELYVAGLLTMGGVRCVLAEPDIILDYCGTACGLSAKRVRSLRQAPKTADEAADQLVAANLRGFVAVNVDVLLKAQPGGLPSEATLAQRLAIVEQIEARMAEREEVLGTWTLGRDCLWDFNEAKPKAAVSHTIRFTAHPRRDEERVMSEEFFARMMDKIESRMEGL
jgi:hypothetical protein